MSATAVHPAAAATELSLPKPAEDLPSAPQWINDLMDAAAAGETEFRKEVRTQIKDGRGPELISIIQEMIKGCTNDKAKEATQTLLEAVTKWVENPEELEEGGRFYGGLFGSAFGCGYYPTLCGTTFPGWSPFYPNPWYHHHHCLPPIYTGCHPCWDPWWD